MNAIIILGLFCVMGIQALLASKKYQSKSPLVISALLLPLFSWLLIQKITPQDPQMIWKNVLLFLPVVYLSSLFIHSYYHTMVLIPIQESANKK